VLAARTVGGLEEVDDAVQGRRPGATLVPMDLADGAAVDWLGGALHEKFGRLDISSATRAWACSPVGHIELKPRNRRHQSHRQLSPDPA
jgi:hypothetical protein